MLAQTATLWDVRPSQSVSAGGLQNRRLSTNAGAQGSARPPDLTCVRMMGAEWEQRSAANCAQTRSDAVIVPTREALTCSNVLEQRFSLRARSVRDEVLIGCGALLSSSGGHPSAGGGSS
jgi:hypothetical protein